MQIGCHVSIAGGVPNAPGRAADLGCETMQIFTRSPQGGKAPELAEAVVKSFKDELKKYKLSQFVVHAPYFINFGSGSNRTFYGSVSVVRQELERSSLLGARYLMVHLGTYKELGEEKGREQVLKGLQKVLDGYDGSTELLLENAAGAGDVIGANFEQLEFFVKALKKHKGFGGICFDTQHAFASGYDLSDATAIKKTLKKFDDVIGLKYLRMIHANDSKIELGGKRDRHDHIDEGKIGAAGFQALLEYLAKPAFAKSKEHQNLPLILETEHDKVKADILKLKQLRGE